MCVCTEGTGCQGLKVQRRPASVASCVCDLGQVHFCPLNLFFLISKMGSTGSEGFDMKLGGESAGSGFVCRW